MSKWAAPGLIGLNICLMVGCHTRMQAVVNLRWRWVGVVYDDDKVLLHSWMAPAICGLYKI